jgi:hypothetical protein
MPRVQCPSCSQIGTVTPGRIGRKIRCPSCRHAFFPADPDPIPLATPGQSGARATTAPRLVLAALVGVAAFVAIAFAASRAGLLSTDPRAPSTVAATAAPAPAPAAAAAAAELPPVAPQPPPRTWSREEFTRIVKGHSTDDVVAAIGPPDTTYGVAGARESTWIFRWRTVDTVTGKTDHIAIVTVRDGRVISIAY